MSTPRKMACVALGVWALGCCRGLDDPGPGGASSSTVSGQLLPVSLGDLPGSVTDAHCSRDDGAKVDAVAEASIAALGGPVAPKEQRRFGFRCLDKADVLVALDYGDEATARRALLHYAHLFVLPADPKRANALPRGDVARRGAIVAVTVGETFQPIAIALRRERAFVTAVPGFPSEERGGAGSALPFVSRPGAFDRARLARDYDYGCPEKVPATVHACRDLERYESGGEAPRPGSAPEVYLGTCVVKPYPTPTSPGVVEEACWFLWSPLGIDMGTVRSLGVELGGASMDDLRTKGAAALPRDSALALRDAVVEHGPGAPIEWVDGAHRALIAKNKETLSVRADTAGLLVVHATNDRKKDALLVAGFERAGLLAPR